MGFVCWMSGSTTKGRWGSGSGVAETGMGWGPPGEQHGQWKESGARGSRFLSSGPSSAAHCCVTSLQVAGPSWASVSTSVQMGTFIPALPTSQGCCEELMR